MKIAVGDALLHAEQHGSGPDVVMVHGVGASSARVWAWVLPGLAEHFRVLVYDLRGLGRSSNPSRVQSIAQHATDAVALLDPLRIADAHLVGFSTGGLVVQEVALRHPERVRSLTLVATNAGLRPEQHADYEERLALIEVGDMAAYVERQLGRGYSPNFVAARPEVAAWYREQFLANDSEAYIGAMRATLGTNLRERLGGIRCPTLVISGANDRSPMSGPRELELTHELHRLIPDAQLVIVPDAGHYVQVEQPEAFVAAVRDFLERVERSRSGA